MYEIEALLVELSTTTARLVAIVDCLLRAIEDAPIVDATAGPEQVLAAIGEAVLRIESDHGIRTC